MISMDDFKKVDMRVGTIIDAIKISEVKSEVLVLGADSEDGVILLTTDRKIENGKRVY